MRGREAGKRREEIRDEGLDLEKLSEFVMRKVDAKSRVVVVHACLYLCLSPFDSSYY